MTDPAPEALTRLDELLAESMLRELSGSESAELEQFADQEGDALLAEAEQAAVATQLAFASAAPVPMPEALRATLRAQAQAYFAHADTGSAPAPAPATFATPTPARGRLLPWLLTAVASLLALLGWWPKDSLPTSPGAQLQAMLDAAPPDLLRLPWQALDDPTAAGAGGELLWSDQEQRGYMRIRGLAHNDPTVEQYQLWIFDDPSDTTFPVDGGVFDIPAGQDEVIIPIDAKIHVKQAFQFAVTVEQPGGVVVSKRERIPLLAAVGS